MPERIEFSADLYSAVAVERAVSAFGGLANLSVDHGDDAVTVTVTDPDAELADVLADELANFVLNETILLHRAPTSTLR